jgi:ureidoacrylate peracid hydrolase
LAIQLVPLLAQMGAWGRGRIAGANCRPDRIQTGLRLEPLPGDLWVKKIKYSAFIAGSSDIDAQLRCSGIDTLLIAGTAINVCCESTARDARMLDYRVIMLSDANATLTDESIRQRSTASCCSSATS